MQHHNKTLFPFEEKELKEAYNKIPYDEVVNYAIDKRKKQIIVVYHNDKFYQIPVKRYLEKNYLALKPYKDYTGTHPYDFDELGNAYGVFDEDFINPFLEEDEEEYAKPAFVFGLNEYEKEHFGDGYSKYLKRYNYKHSIYRRLRYALRCLENPFIRLLSRNGYFTLVNGIVTEEIKNPEKGILTQFKNEKKIDVLRVFDEEVNEHMKIHVKNYEVYEELIELNKRKRINLDRLKKILTFCKDGQDVRNLAYLLKFKNEYSIDSLYEYYLRCERFQDIVPMSAHSLLSEYIKMCDCIAIKPNYYPNSLKKTYYATKRIYDAVSKEKKSIEVDNTYSFQDGEFIIKQAINEEKFNKLKEIFGHDRLTINNDFYYLYSLKDTNKELAIINTTEDKENIEQHGIYTYRPYVGNKRETTGRKLNKKERRFIKIWLNHNRQLNLKHQIV